MMLLDNLPLIYVAILRTELIVEFHILLSHQSLFNRVCDISLLMFTYSAERV